MKKKKTKNLCLLHWQVSSLPLCHQRSSKTKQACFHTKSLQSCQTLCDPMDCSPPGSSVHGIYQVKNTGMSCHVLLQGIFSTQGLNPSFLHCRQILYHLSHQGSPTNKQTNINSSKTLKSNL